MGTTILLPFQALNAQNATVQMGNATTEDQVSSNVLQTLAQPGLGNVYNVIDKEGNNVPVSYNIIGGQVVGILGDPKVTPSISLLILQVMEEHWRLTYLEAC
jgi:hypothetical protein